MPLGPRDLTVDAAGNAWYTRQGGMGIGEVKLGAPAGTPVTVFPTLVPMANGITAGPDGNLWYTGNGYSVIGRITHAGVDHRVRSAERPADGRRARRDHRRAGRERLVRRPGCPQLQGRQDHPGRPDHGVPTERQPVGPDGRDRRQPVGAAGPHHERHRPSDACRQGRPVHRRPAARRWTSTTAPTSSRAPTATSGSSTSAPRTRSFAPTCSYRRRSRPGRRRT